MLNTIQCKALLPLLFYCLLNALLKQNMKDKLINFETKHTTDSTASSHENMLMLFTYARGD